MAGPCNVCDEVAARNFESSNTLLLNVEHGSTTHGWNTTWCVQRSVICSTGVKKVFRGHLLSDFQHSLSTSYVKHPLYDPAAWRECRRKMQRPLWNMQQMLQKIRFIPKYQYICQQSFTGKKGPLPRTAWQYRDEDTNIRSSSRSRQVSEAAIFESHKRVWFSGHAIAFCDYMINIWSHIIYYTL